MRIDPRYFRPAEVDTLLGDPRRAHEKLGWTPTTTLEELVAEMVTADREEARKEALLRLKGFQERKLDELREYLLATSALDPHPLLADAEQDDRVRAATPELDGIEAADLAAQLRAQLERSFPGN